MIRARSSRKPSIREIAVIGFDATERAVVGSVFRLSELRFEETGENFVYRAADAERIDDADIVLVNADRQSESEPPPYKAGKPAIRVYDRTAPDAGMTTETTLTRRALGSRLLRHLDAMAEIRPA